MSLSPTPTPDEILAQEFDEDFIAHMRARILQGYFTYGPSKRNAPQVDLLRSAKERIAKYEATGNTEWLVDAANFCMMEFKYPSHEDAHFRSTNESESPGVRLASGRIASAYRVRSLD